MSVKKATKLSQVIFRKLKECWFKWEIREKKIVRIVRTEKRLEAKPRTHKNNEAINQGVRKMSREERLPQKKRRRVRK